ncbi:hypothetical protein P9112_014017 [Eukaryota sp. TZLM1-RC]
MPNPSKPTQPTGSTFTHSKGSPRSSEKVPTEFSEEDFKKEPPSLHHTVSDKTHHDKVRSTDKRSRYRSGHQQSKGQGAPGK